MNDTSKGKRMPITEVADFLARLEAADHRGGEGRAVVEGVGSPPLAVAVADLDRFGAINEREGCASGDRGRTTFERVRTGSLGRDAVIARIGGDEYAIALPRTSAESALIQLEEVRTHYATHGVDGVDGEVNASFGIAARPPHAE